MAWGKKSGGGGGGAAWLALLVSLAALFLAWKAYQRTGGRFDEILAPLDQDVSVGEPADGDWREELERARERLLERRGDLDAGTDTRQVQEDVARIRERLADLRDAGASAREGWRELDADLERLQGQLRQGSSRARETLDSALARMREMGEP